jgi:hypothetical protein
MQKSAIHTDQSLPWELSVYDKDIICDKEIHSNKKGLCSTFQ